MDKRKVRADDIIIISMIATIIVMLLFFRLIALMSTIVFPMFILFLYGIYKFFSGLVKRGRDKAKNLITGIFSIPFGLLILIVIFSQPDITRGYLIYFLAIPIMIIGFAGIIKGFVINVYSTLHRLINVIIGIMTLIETAFAYFTADKLFSLHLTLLFCMLLFNGIARVALYLSEYGISIIHLRHLVIIKFLFEIIAEVPIEVVSEEISGYQAEN